MIRLRAPVLASSALTSALCSARRDPTGGDIATTKRREVRTERVAGRVVVRPAPG